MKNLLYIAAIAATAVGFTSCSSNEDLNDAVKDSGVPFKVTASAPTTRATDLTSSNFTNFQLYAFEGTNEWISGKLFTKNTSWEPASGTGPYAWPTANTLSDFYGVSENAASMSSAFVDDIKTSQSFTYTVPTTIADQKDLLVAHTTGKSTDAQVALAFKHALANATLTLKLDPSKTDQGTNKTSKYRLAIKIKSISINNVKTIGKYNYSTSTWSDQATDGTYTFDFSASPIVIDTYYNTIPTNSINIDGSNGKLMFIPQTLTSWDIAPNTTTTQVSDLSSPPAKSYITMQAISLAYVPTDVVTDCEALVTGGTLTKLGDGYYTTDGNNTKVATLDGQVIDFDFTSFNDYSGSAYPETQAFEGTAGNIFNDFTNAAGYTKLYKPFKLINANNELLINYTHNIVIELTTFVRSKDAAATFGKGANVQGAKIR